MRQQMQQGQTFGFRVPTHANKEVLDYFNAYLRQHPRGLGKHMLEVLMKGLELEGAPPQGLPDVSKPRPRRSRTWRAVQTVRAVPRHVSSPQSVTTIGAAVRGVNVNDHTVGTQAYLDLGNFE